MASHTVYRSMSQLTLDLASSMALMLLEFMPRPATGNGNFVRQIKYRWVATTTRRTVIVYPSFGAGLEKPDSTMKLHMSAYGASKNDFSASDMPGNSIVKDWNARMCRA